MPSQISSAKSESVVSTTPRMPGLAVVERAHGVEGVRGADGAGGDGGAGFGRGGVGVADGDAHTARGGVRGQFDCAGQLGRQRHEAHVALGGFKEPVEDGDVGREQMLGGLHAALGVREERSFEMNADAAVRRDLGSGGSVDELGEALDGAQRCSRAAR